MVPGNESLEKLLDQSARLLKLNTYNENDKNFKNVFNLHFSNMRNLGYIVCCNEISSCELEVYFRIIGDMNSRTIGTILRY